ncbi:putative membrane protein [Lasiodiplodia theobromae]|uniref:Putative membrane protein n=1 Tax=Lasiodiplodia theobromae TaxID=45133 RepID=A0A5N5D5H5_9PEZI|nr:putative membrane protein [Lasiodiplodia theobromae]
MSQSYQTFPSSSIHSSTDPSTHSIAEEETQLIRRDPADTTTDTLLTTMPGIFWTIGSLYGAASVAIGAFGAHGLKSRIADPQRIANWNTAAHYQLIHSGVILLASVAAPQNKLAMTLLTAGVTMFSGSIYLLVLDPARFKALGPVTPLGGLCMIGGWAALAFGRGRVPVPPRA